jgi:SAM-dependent methyltransferase
MSGRPAGDARLYSPSAARNRDAIRAVALAHLPQPGRVLELASGSGEHAVHLAAALPTVRWWPGDPDPRARDSIRAWLTASGLANLEDPHATDVADRPWPTAVEDAAPFDALVAINLVHIAPFEAAVGLFSGAGRLLRPGGKLLLYGPFARAGAHTADSNGEFDRSLRARDPRWGVRDLEYDLLPLAAAQDLELTHVIPMPANNFSVILGRAPRA